MKAHFKKLTLLSFRDDRDQLTKLLQELGVIHLELHEERTSRSTEELDQEKTRFKRARTIILQQKNKKSNHDFLNAQKEKLSGKVIVDEVLKASQQLENNLQQLEALKKDEIRLKPWGDFDYQKVQQLTKHDIHIQFCIADRKSFKTIPSPDKTLQVVHEGPDQVYFVIISYGEKVEVPCEVIDLPHLRLKDIQEVSERLHLENDLIQDRIRFFQLQLNALESELVSLENELVFAQAQSSYDSHSEGTILSITGWFPSSMEGRIIPFLENEKIVYGITDPTPTDQIPVLLKNASYPKLFESITRIFELPNYHELDPTPLIAVFYPILFSYCLGDAGYGSLLILGATIGWFTFLKSARNMALLGLILGLFTTLMGLVKSGSIFGIPLSGADSIPLFQFLAPYVIIPDDRDFLFNSFNIALMIGVVQIFLGIIISIYNKITYESFTGSLSQIGKFLIVFNLIWIFLADMQQMEILQPLRLLRQALLVAGILLVMFFHDLTVSVLRRPVGAVLPLFFIATGILGDILSYVRLFALGVASSVLGLVVNQIGLQIMGNSWWGIAIGILFLLFGHSLNFGIALLGAFVHPLRLTFVEFYNNAQFRGGGTAYRPFRKIKLTR